MLEYLRIQNLAIIEDVELDLGPGLSVITGETGAGKSIVVGAIGVLRGGRLSREIVRDGAEQATVEAVLRPGSRPGGEAPAEPLTLSRVMGKGGRSRQRLDGELVTAAELARVVAPLVDISGQHDGQSLTDPATHRALLDAAGVPEQALAAVREAVLRLDGLAAQLRQRNLDEREREARLDLLRYQLGELDALRPEVGEGEALELERRRLGSAAELEEGARAAVALLYEDEGCAADRLGQAARRVETAAALDPSLQGIPERLQEAQAIVDDVARELLRYAESIEGDPARLAMVEERLAELRRLCRKHGETVDGLVELRERIAGEIADLTDADARLASLRAELDRARSDAARAAEAVTEARSAAARELSRAVEENLGRLGMKGARFEVRIGPREPRRGDDPERIFGERRLGPEGWDRVELFVAPNPGEEAHALSRTASGGELSRIMLALKLVLADRDSVVTYVFDEVDAGIGGATADAVGLALAEVARHRQVICITHLASIAAYADRHLRVDKRQRTGRTLASLSVLSDEGRIEEVARMLGGAEVTAAQRKAAAELIEAAQARRFPPRPARARRPRK